MKGKGASDQMLFGDINDLGISGDRSQAKMLDVWAGSTSAPNRLGKRHFGGSNTAWLDGHVERRKAAQMMGNTQKKWLTGGIVYGYYFMIAPKS